ncbi:triose-phosphate isomerase [Candidatus Pelagibacter sp.]|nr:triose-phosphate isomerase [Candidatus Pelagibacter sp.]
MTNKYKYFVANWKMFGDIKSVNSINRVIKLSKSRKFKKVKIIYCPPYTLINNFVQKLKKTKIDVGAQNCHQSDINGPFTGSINSKMVKNLGCSYIIIGHSENRINGDDNTLINKKIKVSLNHKLKILFCIGETLKEKKAKKTKKILTSQIINGLKNIKNIKKIIFAYEPVWAIGTGIIPKEYELINNIVFIKKLLKKRFKSKNPKVLYGGSVNPKNIKEFRTINQIDGFLIGGASQSSNKFIDIIKKTFN